jgi:hypothetical protein
VYKECCKDYVRKRFMMELPIGLKNAKSIEMSMKNGRKVFRLMK